MIIAANWKMNLLSHDARDLASEFQKIAKNQSVSDVQILIFPPAIYANMVNDVCDDKGLSWGGQNTHIARFGAHTGDISAEMYRSVGARYQLVGHSERRADHKESDSYIGAQLRAAHEAGLHMVLCVGEQLDQREAGDAEKVVTDQIARALDEVKDYLPDLWDNLIIAYEPVWAIGTGRVAEPQDVFEMHKAIADYCTNRLGAPQRPQILYGGSVKAENAQTLFALDYVDGALVGGASLKHEAFSGIVAAAIAVQKG